MLKIIKEKKKIYYIELLIVKLMINFTLSIIKL